MCLKKQVEWLTNFSNNVIIQLSAQLLVSNRLKYYENAGTYISILINCTAEIGDLTAAFPLALIMFKLSSILSQATRAGHHFLGSTICLLVSSTHHISRILYTTLLCESSGGWQISAISVRCPSLSPCSLDSKGCCQIIGNKSHVNSYVFDLISLWSSPS